MGRTILDYGLQPATPQESNWKLAKTDLQIASQSLHFTTGPALQARIAKLKSMESNRKLAPIASSSGSIAAHQTSGLAVSEIRLANWTHASASPLRQHHLRIDCLSIELQLEMPLRPKTADSLLLE